MPCAEGTKYSQDTRKCNSLHRDGVPADARSLQSPVMKFLVVGRRSKLSMRGKQECSFQLLLRELATVCMGFVTASSVSVLNQDCSLVSYGWHTVQWI